MNDDDTKFREMMSTEMATEALGLLEKQLERCRKWRSDFWLETGREATMHDLIMQIMSEPNKKTHVLVAYGAALWQMMEES